MEKNNFSKIHNIQSLKNILTKKDKRLASFKKNLKFKSKNYNLPKLKSELFTTLITKSNNNKRRNNFLTSSNLSLSDNETFNIQSKDYLYKHRNIRKQILTNPNLSPIDSKELTLYNSDNGERKNNKMFYSVNSSENINNNSKDLFLSRSSRSLNNSNSKNKTLSIERKTMKRKNIEKKNNTIINIFNTSLNNTPNIYFFSPMITESNSKKEINNEINDNNALFNIKRNNTFFSPIKMKKTRKMLTLNMHMFHKLKNFNIKKKNKKPKKQLQKRNSLEELKLEEIKENIMKNSNFNSNKDIFNYSDGNDKKIIYLLKKKQKIKSTNNINETKNYLTFNSLSSIKNSDNESNLSIIESYKNFDFFLIEEKRKKLEEKLVKSFGIINSKQFEKDFLKKKNIFINQIFNEKYDKISNKIESQLKHRFSIINIDLKKYYKKEKLYILKSGKNFIFKVEKYYLKLLYKSSFIIKYNLNKYSAKELIDIYFEKETYNLLKEKYLKANDSELISIIKDFELEMKIEKQLNKNRKFISKTANYIYFLVKFIMNDIQDGIFRKPIGQKKMSIFLKKANKIFKTITPFRKSSVLRRKSALKSIAVSKNISEKMSLFKRTLTRKKLRKNNNVGSKFILKTEYFNRKGERNIKDQILYIRNLKLRPSIKIQNIQFNVEDPREAIQKNKNMTKEGLIFRTEEIKAEMKKNLKTIEEILFFLIKENNFREFIDILEKYHVSIESKNKKGSTFLVYSAQCNNVNFVTYLLEKGANINAQDKNLNTALHYALSDNNFYLADMLLRNGANERLINNNGLTPWQMMSK